MDSMKNELDNLRNKINKIDEEMVVLLIKRMHLALKISDFKDSNLKAITAKGRVSEVLERVTRLAIENNGDEMFVRKIYTLIIEDLTRMQLKKKGVV